MAATVFSSVNAQEAGWPLSTTPATTAARLAAHAVQALLDEADLSPKPALVDQRGSGAHADLTLALMHRSARALFCCFEAIAAASLSMVPSQSLRNRLGAIGRAGEQMMFVATGGANTHKGAIWSLGLLVAGAAICLEMGDASAIPSTAGAIARCPDSFSAPGATHGARMETVYGVSGARGEAQQGFPHVVTIGLPALIDARLRGVPEHCARLDALMAIMASLNDTCLLHRGGMPALHAAQRGAQRVLREGGTSSPRGIALLLDLDAMLVAMNASPGGSADLLAATLFLDSMTRASAKQRVASDSDGDLQLWKN